MPYLSHYLHVYCVIFPFPLAVQVRFFFYVCYQPSLGNKFAVQKSFPTTATKSFPFFFPTMSTCKWTSLYRDTVRIMDGVERALQAKALSFRFQSGAMSFTQKKRQLFYYRRTVSIDSKFNRALGFPLRFCGLSTSNNDHRNSLLLSKPASYRQAKNLKQSSLQQRPLP
jgi:hypothetical protein